MKKDKTFRPDRVLSYFKAEWLPLAFVTLSGLVYNIGLLATPWFEGRLAQCLADILGGSETAAKMAMLVLAYIVVTLAVQAARFIKRFYVRRFANNINRRMKGILYANLVRQSRAALEKEGAGELMTKAISFWSARRCWAASCASASMTVSVWAASARACPARNMHKRSLMK